MKKGTNRRVWQIRVDLEDVWPPVWRRILVPDTAGLLRLHQVIQAAFGWWDYHLHEFRIHGAMYGDPASDEFGESNILDEEWVKLRDLELAEGESFSYVYDFGDDWRHRLRLEKIRPPEKRERLPRCVDGRRACPPEDAGGPGGYQELLLALGDPEDSEHERYLEWVGGSFDPEAFDPKEADRRLAERDLARRGVAWVSPELIGGTTTGKRLPGSAFERAPSAVAASEHEETARQLPLRRDVEAFLLYLRDHKVTGTSSTGNLPLKAVKEVAAVFVEPPELVLRFGTITHPIRSEDEVWPIAFVHRLAYGAELAGGGPGRRWRLTERGGEYLSAPAAAQVFILLHAWWHRVDWRAGVPHDIFGDTLSPVVPEAVLTLLEGLDVGRCVGFDLFVDTLIDAVGWVWTPRGPEDRTRLYIGRAVRHMVADPLEELGVLFTERIEKTEYSSKWTEVVAFSLTDFGRALLEGLRVRSAR